MVELLQVAAGNVVTMDNRSASGPINIPRESPLRTLSNDDRPNQPSRVRLPR